MVVLARTKWEAKKERHDDEGGKNIRDGVDARGGAVVVVEGKGGIIEIVPDRFLRRRNPS